MTKNIGFTKYLIYCFNFTYFRCHNQKYPKGYFCCIWKINTLVLHVCKTEGGTSLIDIEFKTKSLKAAWVKYFVYENKESNLINATFKQYKIELTYLL